MKRRQDENHLENQRELSLKHRERNTFLNTKTQGFVDNNKLVFFFLDIEKILEF